MNRTLSLSLLALLWAWMTPAPATAADPVDGGLVDNDKPKEIKKKDGWDFLLNPGLSASLSDNRKVVGQPNGLTATLGAQIMAGTKFKSGDHQWRNDLQITEAFTRTPVLEEFVKTTDIFKFESIYLYNLLDWLGPYVRFGLATNMLEGYSVQPDFVRWRTVFLDAPDEFRTAQRYRLTDGFMPLQLRESAGFFAQPYKETFFTSEIRAGFGGLHMLAEDQFALKDDGATPELDVIELDSFDQAGVELGLALGGELYEKKLVYKLTLEVLIPVIYDLPEDDDRGIGELTNVELNASLSYKVYKWLSLDYVFRLVRVPQLVEDWQVQNNLLLTASWSFFEPEKEEK